MTNFTAALIVCSGLLAADQVVETPPPSDAPFYEPMLMDELGCCAERRPFQSDHCFDGFVGPITNPVLSKDPRTLTEARLIFLNNWFPSSHPLTMGGQAQVYAMQVRVALTERLSLIAEKDGYIDFNTPGYDNDGWANLAGGLKYLLVRDVENQFLLSSGFMYEFSSGEDSVFQSNGSGLLTVFATAGKEFGGKTHVLWTVGEQFAMNSSRNSSFFYSSAHIDREFFGWFYPLAELNWFHYTSSGNRGLPSALGEGDGLINLGTSGVTGNDLVTGALGAKIRFTPRAELGVAWEHPLSNREDLIQDRLVVDFILRY